MGEKGKKFWRTVKDCLIWFLKSYLWIIPLFFAFDLWSKLGVKMHQQEINAVSAKGLPIIPGFFYIYVIQNTGAAWSMFNNHPEILAVISLVATVIITVFLVYKYPKLTNLTRISLYLILTGTAGNLIDRSFSLLAPDSLYGGGVIDFLSLWFGNYSFPVFNIADACLTTGVVLLLVALLAGDYSDKKKARKIEEDHHQMISSIEKKIGESKEPESDEKTRTPSSEKQETEDNENNAEDKK